MKIIVIGGTGLIGSKTAAICARQAMMSSRPPRGMASTASPAKG